MGVIHISQDLITLQYPIFSRLSHKMPYLGTTYSYVCPKKADCPDNNNTLASSEMIFYVMQVN